MQNVEQDRGDAGKEVCRKGGMQDRWDEGKEDEGQERFRTRGIQKRRDTGEKESRTWDAGQEGCKESCKKGWIQVFCQLPILQTVLYSRKSNVQ